MLDTLYLCWNNMLHPHNVKGEFRYRGTLNCDEGICEEIVFWLCFQVADGEAAMLDHGEGNVIAGHHQLTALKPKSRLHFGGEGGPELLHLLRSPC